MKPTVEPDSVELSSIKTEPDSLMQSEETVIKDGDDNLADIQNGTITASEPEALSGNCDSSSEEAVGTQIAGAVDNKELCKIKQEDATGDAVAVSNEEDWLHVTHTSATTYRVTGATKVNFHPSEFATSGYKSAPKRPRLDFRVLLEPGKVYKFRVAGINSMGVGPWSKVASFRTFKPNVPTAPLSVRVSQFKTRGGIELTWKPPANCKSCKVISYKVFLCVKKKTTMLPLASSLKKPSSSSELFFEQIYSGVKTNCFVPKETLMRGCIGANLDKKPYITFRIAANNMSDHGPAIQIRWMLADDFLDNNDTVSSSSKIKLG